MVYFARLDSNNIVKRTHVLMDSVITDSDGKEQESLGVSFLQKIHNTSDTFIQCCHGKRKQKGAVGCKYDKDNDIFIGVQPYPSWTLDSNFDWQSPVAIPTDTLENCYKEYYWNEEELEWTKWKL